MKKLLITLLIISQLSLAQSAKNEVKNTKQVVVMDKKSKARMQVGNKSNNKYMEKYNYQNNNQTIVCESSRNRRNHCTVDTRYGINFIRQLSNSSCNQNWGYDNRGIWVDNGCRAEFSINYGWDQPGSEGNIMVCESHRYQRNQCPAYLNGRDVFLLNQLSSTSCINNWGYDRNGVWVSNGCRAEFVVEDRNWNQNDVIVCSSRNMGFQGCQADTRGGVEFIRQISRASCNGNWGYDRQGIWVANGCRAKFRLLPFTQTNYGNNHNNSTVKCSSRGLKRKVCRADTSGGVQLKRQHSKSSCNGNWGFDRNGVWVTNGCRATFQLHINGYQNNNNSYNNGYGNQNNNNGYNNGYGNQNNNNGYNNGNQNQNNSRLMCASRNLKRKACPIPSGSQVQLTRQLSKSTCTGNWGYTRNEVWVRQGCRAEFTIF